MNDSLTKVGLLISSIGIVVASLLTWYFNHTRTTSINIEQVNATLLSQKPGIDGLTVKYLFHDSIEVQNIWKSLFTIKNTGELPLYGKGFSEINVQNGIIPLEISGCNNVLSTKIYSNNSGSSLIEGQKILVTQWKPNEYIEIEIISEGETAPELIINERGIKDGIITYSKYAPASKIVQPKLIDNFPTWIANILKWTIIVIMGILVLAGISQLPAQLRGKPNSVKIISIIAWIFFVIILICPILWMV